MDRASLQAFIVRQRYGVVSSIGKEGKPQSALVGIACTPLLEIIFDTLTSSRKYANLVHNPACSFVIGRSGEQTLQLEGTAEELHKADQRRLKEIYFEQWPECREHIKWPDIAYFVVHPNWLRYTDYDQSPVVIQEIDKEALSESVWIND